MIRFSARAADLLLVAQGSALIGGGACTYFYNTYTLKC